MRFASLFVLGLAACGGGGATKDMTFAPDLTPPPPPDLQSRLDLATPPMGANVVPMVVDGFGTYDVPYVSIKICIPGTTTCTTVDHITVDTASTGTRILAEALPSDFLSQLPPQTPSTGECYTYASGYVFGSVQKVDLSIGAESASDLPFLLIGDPALPKVPNGCQTTGVEDDTVDTFGSNGIIGVGHFVPDCGSDCANPNKLGQTNPTYYDCTDPQNCMPKTVATADQVPNPVAKFPVDNNGVVLELPAIPELGTPVANGYLIFGVGTQDNNALGDADVYKLDSSQGGWFMTAYYGGKAFTLGAFFDSGSSAFFFPDQTIPGCSDGPACPTSTVQRLASITDITGQAHEIHFRIENGSALEASGNNAFDGWAFTNFGYEDFFDMGLPFFFGRRMYSTLAGVPNPLGTNPFYAVY